MAEYIKREAVLRAVQGQRSPCRSPAQNRMLDCLKADADILRVQLKNANDTAEAVSKELQRVNSENDGLRNKLADTEAALGRANAEVSRLTVGCRQVEDERDYMHQQWSNAEQRAHYAEAHPWRNLWVWFKREAARHE